MFNFVAAIRNSGVFTNASFSFSEQIPVGISFRDNESGKTSRIFTKDVAGQFLTVNCGFDKQYCCGWKDDDIWSDGKVWDDCSDTSDEGWKDDYFWNDNFIWNDKS